MMLSRVADNLYWMSRYLERAEHSARLLAVHLNLVLDQHADAADQRRARMLDVLHAPAPQAVPPPDDADACRVLTFDLQNTNSIVASIRAARENARQVREQINQEMWKELNGLYLFVRDAQMDEGWNDRAIDFYEEIIQRSQLFQGITDSTMNHGQGWHFIQVGRYLERALNTSRYLSIEFGALYGGRRHNMAAGEPGYLDWLGLLRGVAAFEAYNKVYTFDLQPTLIAEFLVLNNEFPRSVSFAVNALQSALNQIAEATETHRGTRVHRVAGRLRATLEYAAVDEILDQDVGAYLAEIQQECRVVHDALYQLYITYPIEDKLVL